MFHHRPVSPSVPAGKDAKTPSHPHVVEMHEVVKQFQTEAGPFTALKGIDLELDQREFVGIIGKSGSGKSTLLNMITGIDRPTSGQVYVAGTPVHKLSEGQMARWRRHNLGIIFQFFQLLPTLSLIENVMLPMDFANKYPPRQRADRAMQLLELVGLAPQAAKLPSALSGGQQQRVAIARAMANDPPLIVADEPTGNLDSKTADAMFELFASLVASGKTFLMVTHDNELAKRVSRAVLVLDGEVIEEVLAQTFPTLENRQLALASHRQQARRVEPGATIVRQGAEPNRFYVIAAGEVEVILEQPGSQDIVLNRLGRGQYFGEISLLRGGKATATVRAAPVIGAEVLSFDVATFKEVFVSTATVQQEIEQTAQQRLGRPQSGDPQEA